MFRTIKHQSHVDQKEIFVSRMVEFSFSSQGHDISDFCLFLTLSQKVKFHTLSMNRCKFFFLEIWKTLELITHYFGVFSKILVKKCAVVGSRSSQLQ